MTPADDVIARAARAIAPHFAAHQIRWASWDGRRELTVPGEAEIALALREMVGEIEPGGRIDSGHLVVEWPFEDIEDDGDGDEALGTPGEIRILFHLADVPPREDADMTAPTQRTAAAARPRHPKEDL